jgi:ABC-type sugar transport system ATPase subunit
MESVGVRMNDIHVAYRERHYTVEALRGISLGIEPGEFFVLLGPSGCGKTTLLKVLAGLITPDRGSVELGDRLLFDADEEVDVKPRDREVSFVFQNIALYPHMTVRKNLEFPLKIRNRLSRTERERTVNGIASFLQIEHLLNRKPRQLSGGQLQRVAIGKAMIRDTKLFLMDEPMSNLDAALRRGIRNYFRALQRKLGTTTVYVTHDQKEAMALADRLAVIIGGEVHQVGTPQEVYERPENIDVANFIGESPMNIFRGELVSESDNIYFMTEYARFQMDQELAWKLRRSGRKSCMIGIRPEFIRLAPEGEGTVDARINFAQDTGPTTLVYASLGNRKPVMIELQAPAPRGFARETVGLAFEPQKLNVFTTAGDRIDL